MNFNQLKGDALRAEQQGICRTSGQIRLSWHPVRKKQSMKRLHSVIGFRWSGKETPHVLLLLQIHEDGTLVYMTVCYFLFILLLRLYTTFLSFYFVFICCAFCIFFYLFISVCCILNCFLCGDLECHKYRRSSVE